MLFDLRGRRRRAVQATYLMLALLMGGGLVFFGIGGDVSGGLFDAFSDRDGGSDGNSQLEQRINRNEERLVTSPQNETALAALVRDYYALGVGAIPEGSTELPDEARADLRNSAKFYQRYIDAVDEPSAGLARVALNMYDQTALNQPKEAQRAMQIVAEAENSTEAYLALVSRATIAGDTRTADLAGQKAIDLAPADIREQVRKQVKQLKKPASTQQTPEG